MKRKLVLTSMILGVIVCSMSTVVGAANIASQVRDTAKHDAVQSSWKDRTDVVVGVGMKNSEELSSH